MMMDVTTIDRGRRARKKKGTRDVEHSKNRETRASRDGGWRRLKSQDHRHTLTGRRGLDSRTQGCFAPHHTTPCVPPFLFVLVFPRPCLLLFATAPRRKDNTEKGACATKTLNGRSWS